LFILAMACILVVTRSSETETVARLPSTSSSEASTYGKSLETWTTNQTFDVIPMFFNDFLVDVPDRIDISLISRDKEHM